MSTEVKQLKIDPEFAALCPDLMIEERGLLEASIETDGVRDPVIEWQGLIVDGHNRYSIAKMLRIDCPSRSKDFADRAAVVEWIITNQLGRRNLTDEQKSYLRGKRYHAEKKPSGGQSGNPGRSKEIREQVAQSGRLGRAGPKNKTESRLAQEFGVSSTSIKRDSQFAKAVDALAATDPAAKSRILSGQSGLTMKDVRAGKTEADAKPLTLRAALRKQRAQEKRTLGTNGSASGAISLQDNSTVASPKQKKLAELFEAIKRIAAITDSILSRKDEWLSAVEDEHWTSHTKTTIRNRLSGVETDLKQVHKILK